MPDTVMGILKRLHAEQLEAKEKLGTKWVDSDRLFVNDEGAPLFCGTPYNFLLRFTKRHNMRFCNVRSYRRTSATLMLYGGVNIKQVQHRLGHGDIETTNKYLHVLEETDKTATNVLGQMIENKGDKKTDDNTIK